MEPSKRWYVLNNTSTEAEVDSVVAELVKDEPDAIVDPHSRKGRVELYTSMTFEDLRKEFEGVAVVGIYDIKNKG